MAYFKNTAIIVFIFYICIERSIALRTYTLADDCKKTTVVYNMESPYMGTSSSGLAKPKLFGGYNSNSQCSMQFIAPGGYSVLLVVNNIDLRSSKTDNVTIYTSPYSSRIFFGSSNYPSEFTSKNITVVLQSGPGSILFYKGFEFVVTTFDDSYCYDTSMIFKCKNFRCIAKDLRCDGYNHCGDGSDQRCGPTGGAIAGYTFGCIFLVIAIIAGIVYCKKRTRVVTTTTNYPATRYPPPGATIPTTTYPPYGTTVQNPPPPYQTYPQQQNIQQSAYNPAFKY